MVVFSPALEVKIDLTLRLTPEQLAQGVAWRREARTACQIQIDALDGRRWTVEPYHSDSPDLHFAIKALKSLK